MAKKIKVVTKVKKLVLTEKGTQVQFDKIMVAEGQEEDLREMMVNEDDVSLTITPEKKLFDEVDGKKAAANDND